MSHQDDVNLRKNASAIKGILETAIPTSIAELTRHGNAERDPVWLASIALTCWGLMTEGTLGERVSKACRVVGHVSDRAETMTRQGLMKALRTCGPKLVKRMIGSLAGHVQSLKGYWTTRGRVNIAVDGTKFAAPRTKANQAYFAAARRPGTRARSPKPKKYQKDSDQSKASTVQVLTTVFWHLSSGLPLQWTTSASHGSERLNAAQMLDELPPNARILGDAEYVGYPLWSKIHDSGRSFLVRVGSNMTFLTQMGERRFEEGFVHYWPQEVMRAGKLPLVLRLIKIHEGEKAIYLVTNEIDMDDETANRLYSERWGIEVFFRTVKQTCERAKLHCHQPENVLSELNWTLLGIWHALFAGKQAMVSEGRSPHDISPSKTVDAISEVVEMIFRVTTPISRLEERLKAAVLKNESQRTTSKKSRNYPRKKKYRRCGAPKIEPATDEQRQRFKHLQI